MERQAVRENAVITSIEQRDQARLQRHALLARNVRLRRDPERTPAQHQTQRDAGALMIAALHPSNPVEAAYAVRATAAHVATMECFRRTTHPDTPDIIGLRWCGKALALSRMATDMIRTLEECQAATLHAQQQQVVWPDESLSQAPAAEARSRCPGEVG
jgi:hypothetical protein